MTPTQISLLKRALKSTGEIPLSDNMAHRLQEIGAMNNLRRMGYATVVDRPNGPPGPPHPPMYMITEAGREAVEAAADRHS